MNGPAPDSVAAAIERLVRADQGRLLAALIARLGSFQLAEDAMQEALASAVTHWSRNGVPERPQGWVLRVAGRKAIDRLRRDGWENRKIAALRPLLSDLEQVDKPEIADDRLRLIFTCCHPALERKTQMALTLRTICGLSTGEVAALFLDTEVAMGQRLTRAKAKIAKAGIAYAVPGPDQWPDRLQSVLSVIYLVFSADYASSAIASRNLAQEAIFLASLLNQLRPEDAEIEGCLALLDLTHARRAARTDGQGVSVPLGNQDRTKWDSDLIAQGLALIDRAMTWGRPGPYQIKAAIAALHSRTNPPDWKQIVMLYDSLLRFEPTPVVRLQRAVALAEAGWLEGALEAIAWLEPALDEYQPFHAARAELFSRAGHKSHARLAYQRALHLTRNPADRALLEQKLKMLG